MNKFAAILLLPCLLAGCSTQTVYQAKSPGGVPRPPEYPIPVYSEGMEIPRPVKLIGEIAIKPTALTMTGGNFSDEMTRVLKIAHEQGADAIQIDDAQRPGFDSSSYRVAASFYVYADIWEQYNISMDSILTYLRQHAATLDPIEGVWTDGQPDRVAIIRNHSQPGREFIGLVLDTASPAWHLGYKKLDISRDARSGFYDIRYYHNDFASSDVIVPIDQNQSFNFLLNSRSDSYPVTFTKIYPAPAAH